MNYKREEREGEGQKKDHKANMMEHLLGKPCLMELLSRGVSH